MSECEFNFELSSYYDDHLTPERRSAFEKHLAGCAACTEELRAFANLSRLLAVQPALRLPEGARRRLYIAARNAAVPGIMRLVRTLTAAAAVILIAATLQFMWMHPAPGPTAMPAAWEQAAVVGDLPNDAMTNDATADVGAEHGDLRLANWIADDLSQRGRGGQD